VDPNRQPEAERALIERLRARDETAVAQLSSDYAPRVYQLALRYLKNVEDAEEITQDVLLKAYEKIDDFRGDAALSSWLFRIAFNTAMSRLRHLRLARAAERPQDDVPADAPQAIQRRHDAPDRGALADEALFRRQLRHRLARAVRDLPDIYRAPVILRDLRGLSTEEASTALRLNDQTLKSRLHRGRLMLRQKLSEFSGGLTLRLQN
jgi:RNA polymerase sigma-70 factor (ECF subfamily)